MFPGFGTLLNVAAVLAGASLGVLVGHRLPTRTRDVVTDALGLVTLLVAATSAAVVVGPEFIGLVGDSATVLVVLGALLIGGVVGSLLRIEARLEGLGAVLQRRFTRRRSRPEEPGVEERRRFIEGYVSASLLFCVGPLTVLGSLSDGLGRGIDQLALKSVLDGFASIAFAASLGWGVAAAAITVLAVQGSITVLGVALDGLLPDGHVASITATGGLLLVGVALRLLRIKQLPVGDLLPALLVAPLLAQLVAVLR